MYSSFDYLKFIYIFSNKELPFPSIKLCQFFFFEPMKVRTLLPNHLLSQSSVPVSRFKIRIRNTYEKSGEKYIENNCVLLSDRPPKKDLIDH